LRTAHFVTLENLIYVDIVKINVKPSFTFYFIYYTACTACETFASSGGPLEISQGQHVNSTAL